MLLLSFGQSLLEFYNIIFLCSFAFALIFLIMQMLGVLGDDVDLDGDADASNVDTDSDAEINGSSGALNRILSFFGIGKAPIGVWLFIFFFIFGLTGLVSNLILFDKYPEMLNLWFPFIFILSLILALLLSRFFSSLVSKWLPKSSSHSISGKYELIRREGKVRFGMSLSKGGSVSVIDAYGNLHNVKGYLDDSIKADVSKKLPQGTAVRITDYDESRKSYIVIPINKIKN